MLFLFTGKMGAGKTYDAVELKILKPLMETDRKIFTNIDGFQKQECLDAVDKYCGKKVSDRIVFLSDKDIGTKVEYWYHRDDQPAPLIDFSGGILVIDEFHRVFPKKSKSPATLMFFEFLTYQRHLTSADGHATDVVLLTQSPRYLSAELHDIIQETHQFLKQDFLGSAFKNKYRHAVYEGYMSIAEMRKAHKTKDGVIHNSVKTYNPAVFACYKSANGVVKDGKRDYGIFSLKRIILFLLVALPFPILLYIAIGYFSPDGTSFGREKKDPTTAEAQTLTDSNNPDSTNTNTSQNKTAVSKAHFDNTTTLNNTAQYIGEFRANGERVFMFNQDGHRKYALSKDFKAITDYGVFVKFELHNGDIISDVYTNKKSDAVPNNTTSNSQKSQELK